MKYFPKTLFIAAALFVASLQSFSQSASSEESLPTDYLTKEFHKGRREALRNLMPENSVAVIFAYPERVFSQDVNYIYHPNPDLYYFSGYKETSAVLLIFKDMQHDADGNYNEVFFVQRRDPAQEQWTGKRLGVEGTKSKLGFSKVYNSEEFEKFPVDLKRFTVMYDGLPDDANNLKPLIDAFKSKTGIPDIDNSLLADLGLIIKYGNPKNIHRILDRLRSKFEFPAYKNSALLQGIISKPDSAGLADMKTKFDAQFGGIVKYGDAMTTLRGVKLPEEVELIRKSVKISSLAHAEVMRAIKPGMSERELQGIFEYVHKKYGAEDEGYPPIVGAGANGCILHYEENNVTALKSNQLVLMDVGSEYHGYSADVTRTVPANGKFTGEQKAIYQIVYNAQEEIFKLCKAGVPFGSLNEKATQVLADGLIKLGIIKEAKEVGKYYPHGCSHHMGLDVHDKGAYGSDLKENMVITVEPGIYIPAGSPCDKKWWDIGVRIEDDVVIGKEKCTLLSSDAPRKWEDVEKMVADKSMFDAANFPELK